MRITIKRERRKAKHYLENLGNDVFLDMIFIPGGSFLMGSPESELDRLPRESPQHPVTVTDFFMGRYPLTQAQWRALSFLPQVNRQLNSNPSNFKDDHHPVEQVSWFDAVECCNRLSQHSRRKYRLPTEAEWEYACRAGTTTPFYFGEMITTDLANYRGTDQEKYGWLGFYGQGPRGEYRARTTPVDHFDIANAFGLYDMHGNVWEWCLDHWHDNYEEAPIDGSAWLIEDEEARRVIRGGSWFNGPGGCRSAPRNGYEPDYSLDYIGFRVVYAYTKGFT